MNLWNDGRSTASAQLAGNLVLSDLEAGGEKLARRKGTTFTGKNGVYVGRAVGTDGYLPKQDLHWANVTQKQYQELTAEAVKEGKKLWYLFVTAVCDPPAVHYWKIPGEMVGEILQSFPVKAIHIREEEDAHWLEHLKVTRYHRAINLGSDDAKALQEAFESPPAKPKEDTSITIEQLRRLNSFVKELGGPANVRRALGILDDLK